MLSETEFEAVRSYLHREAGLVFDGSRRAALSTVLADRMASAGLPDVATYLAELTGPDGGAERQRLLDGVTVQETHFFRNAPQVEALRRRVLPELLRRTAGRQRPLTIWSAGCSTGEEPYTLAMLLLELSPVLAARAVRIVGTDVSAEALRSAARATYAGRTLDAVPPLVADRWLEPGPGSTRAVRDQVRRLVELRLHNLVTDPPPFGPGEVDLVVCRNVTIYFDRDVTARLVGSFHDVLAEGGYLLLGHSETLWQVSDAFELVPVGDAYLYRRGHDARTPAGRPRRGLPRALRLPAGRRARSGAATSAAPTREATPTAATPPPIRAASLLDTARTTAAAGRYAAAAAAAAAAVAADPLLTDAWLLLGEVRTTLGQDESAVDALRKAVYLDPALAPAHFLLAGALARLGQDGAASVAYRAAGHAWRQADDAAHREFLGGRDRRELAALCLRLAAEHEPRAMSSAAPTEGRAP